jgi:hypothetical protein
METNPSPTSAPAAEDRRKYGRVGWCVLGVLLLAWLPLFLCMPLWVDCVHYDICARNLLSGGVHYRDTTDVNFPGMVWAHAAVRRLFGWRSEVLRLADLAVLAANVAAALLLLRRIRVSPAVYGGTALAMVVFYFSLSEMCHCQRDFWMLALAQMALLARHMALTRRSSETRGWRSFAWSALEGLCWGIAVWIKPFVVVPGLCVWAVSASWLLRVARPRWRSFGLDLGGLLTGGALAGAAGALALALTGSWPYFWREMAGGGSGYLQSVPRVLLLRHALEVAKSHFPWGFVVLAGAVAAALALVGTIRRASPSAPDRQGDLGRLLFSGLLLAWLAQALFWQIPHDYVVSATVLPAIGTLASLTALGALRPWTWIGWAAFLLVAFVAHPLLDADRLALWARCWSEGSTPEIRDRLVIPLRPSNPARPDFAQLAHVEAFLRDRGVGDGDLFCWNESPLSLHVSLAVLPPAGFETMGAALRHFPERVPELRARVEALRPRYVVVDLAEAGLPSDEIREFPPGNAVVLPRSLPRALFRFYPWRHRAVFRSGRYVVYETSGAPQAAPSGP